MSYKEKLLDYRWSRKRTEILLRDNYTCCGCGINGNEDTLHVHHVHYHDCLDPWAYEDNELETLCSCCHSCLHDRINDREAVEKSRVFYG